MFVQYAFGESFGMVKFYSSPYFVQKGIWLCLYTFEFYSDLKYFGSEYLK